MKKWIFGIVILIFLLIGLYYKLGGFDEVKIEIREIPEIKLNGSHFKGLPDDEKLVLIFEKSETFLNENPGASLYTIYKVEPAGLKDTLDVYVGIESSFFKEQQNHIPVRIPGGMAIVATIKKHHLVMPTPKSIKKKIMDFASSNNLPTPTGYIDKLIGPSEVEVIAHFH